MKRKGICFVCGCTQEDGCDEGCGWANVKQTLCTACAPLNQAQRHEKRKQAAIELDMRREVMEQELAAVRRRLDVLRDEVRIFVETN